eukprot:3088668-Alexandrium_andersonii.AAC.1
MRGVEPEDQAFRVQAPRRSKGDQTGGLWDCWPRWRGGWRQGMRYPIRGNAHGSERQHADMAS